MLNINTVLQDDPLVRLVQKDNFVGWVYRIDYDTAHVMTNDLWKANALGIPHNSFLAAATFDPDNFAGVPQPEREVILLRVVGSSRLPQDDDLVRAKIDHYQDQQDAYARDYDDITLNQMQFGALECRVLGTFYMRDGQLWLGSDLESFAVAARLQVYRPRGAALAAIVNYVDPLARQKAMAEAQALGLSGGVQPFRLGTVRYTSTDRLHRRDDIEKVAVTIQPSDFLARRTAVLGMTRTGKSNMIKHTISVVKRVADNGGAQIGQVVFDLNGEYANANQQDKGSIADVYPADTVRYRMLQTPGFHELQNNFYVQLNEGFGIIQRELHDAGRVNTDYVRTFVNMSLDEPDPKEAGEYQRWGQRVAAYKAILYKAGFEPPAGHVVKFVANAGVRQAVDVQPSGPFRDPAQGLSVPETVAWFEAAREANRQQPLVSSSGKPWVDDTLQVLLDILAQKNANNSFISGYRILSDAVKYHSPRRAQEVGEEIYQLLVDGKIVVLDLSVGDPTLRERISQDVARVIFSRSMDRFINGATPPNVVVYVEEAHNLIGKEHELTDTWPRLAKEGAKYRIALVYATQEVSSVHPNILSNTENWFITHLNNEREVRELARFYDFADFSRSLIRAQDVGFARVKTLSGPFVIPVQIDRFDPDEEKRRLTARVTASNSPAGALTTGVPVAATARGAAVMSTSSDLNATVNDSTVSAPPANGATSDGTPDDPFDLLGDVSSWDAGN